MTSYIISRYLNAYEENATKISLYDWTVKEEKFYCCCIPSHLRGEKEGEKNKWWDSYARKMSQSKCKE